MLTNEDIAKLLQVLATKHDIERLEARIEKLEDSHQRLINSVDALAKAVQNLQVEYHAVMNRVNHMEDWIKKAARKLGLDYNP